MENYTLNRFYHEAKALIEKHDCVDDEKRVVVHFGIEEPSSNKIPYLKCMISYQGRNDYRKDIYGFGNTPSYALEDFEKILQEQKGIMLKEKVSVDITDDLIEPEN